MSGNDTMSRRVLPLANVILVATTVSVLAEPPPTVNLGPEFQKFGLTPLQQGDRGDCSLFAATALAEFELAKSDPDGAVRLSEEFLIWAAHAASATKPDDQAMFYQALHGLNVYGICNSNLMPYANARDSKRKPSKEALADARTRSERWRVHWIKRWDSKTGLTAEELLEIKQTLAHRHPVACGLRWPKKGDGHELLRVPPAKDVEDGHSIALTGFHDDPQQPGGGVLFFRNSFGPEWGNHGYGTMSYAYASTYGNDAVWVQSGAPHSEKPRIRFEAESLPIESRGHCDCETQDMEEWGRGMWSHGKQLVCIARNQGFVQLGLKVEQTGKYRVRVLATAAPDYGRIQTAIDGRAVGRPFDLYCGRVSPSGSLDLGDHELTAGQHHFRFTVEGKNAASTGHLFGIDAIDFLDN
jgi:hypothetical protein